MDPRSGVTLVETIVAVTILGFCITGFALLVAMSKEISDQARNHYVAANLAKNRVESARILKFSQLIYLKESQVIVNDSGLADPSGDFRRTTTVTPKSTNLAEIVVFVAVRDRVSWKFGTEQEEVRSYVADFLEAP